MHYEKLIQSNVILYVSFSSYFLYYYCDIIFCNASYIIVKMIFYIRIIFLQILLIEAGDEEPLVADVPSMMPYLRGSSIDWSYTTQPQRKACKADKNICRWPRGKVMGGCSTINGMLYIRCNQKDYDDWANLGNTGWSYRDVLPYFKKSEDNRVQEVIKTLK